MPLTTLDPAVALVLVDLQRGIAGQPVFASTVANAATLAAAFRAHDLPVVLVNVAGQAPGRTDVALPAGERPADWDQLLPELDPQPGDLRITKHHWGAFIGTDLDAALRSRGAGGTEVLVRPSSVLRPGDGRLLPPRARLRHTVAGR
ncbi:MAG: isochorismatase family protein [Micrococcales bacterium]|nr:isochorismatase family protein [Micrococcales bacterium]